MFQFAILHFWFVQPVSLGTFPPVHRQQRAGGAVLCPVSSESRSRMMSPRMASSSTLSWHERVRLFHRHSEEVVAPGRNAWADGIAWITWVSQVTRFRRFHPWESIRRAFRRDRSARIIRCSGLFRGGPLRFPPMLRRQGEAATSCGSRGD